MRMGGMKALVLISFLFSLVLPLQVKADRIPITLNLSATQTNGVTKTNWQSWINVTYQAGMQSDFSDIRFTDSTDTIILPYYIFKKVDSQFAYVVVNVNSFNASNQSLIYIYYNNSFVTSQSNKTSTFIWAEDWEAGFSSLNNYQLNNSDNFNITDISPLNGTYSINATDVYVGDMRVASYKYANYSVVQNGSVEIQWWSIDNDGAVEGSGWPAIFFGENLTLGGKVCGGYGFMTADSNYGHQEARIVKNYFQSDWVDSGQCGADYDLNLNVTYPIGSPTAEVPIFSRGWWYKNGTMQYNIYNEDDTLWGSTSAVTDTDFTSGYFAVSKVRDFKMDEIYVYKDPKPEYAFGASTNNNFSYQFFLNFKSPSENNTVLGKNMTYFVWNFTSSYYLTNCSFQINGTNQSGTISSDNALCSYNETGITGNVTRCATGLGYNGTVWNETDYRCINTNEQQPFFVSKVSVSKIIVNSSHYYLNGLVNCITETDNELCGNVTAWLETNVTGTWLPVGTSGNITVPLGWISYDCEGMSDKLNFSNVYKYSGNPILVPNASNPLESYKVSSASVLKEDDGYYYMVYSGMNSSIFNDATYSGLNDFQTYPYDFYSHIFIRKSHDRISWTNLNENGIISANETNQWEANTTVGVSASSFSEVYINGTKWYIITYSAFDNTTGEYSIGMKKSQTISANPDDWVYVQSNASNPVIRGAGIGNALWNDMIQLPSKIVYDNMSETYIIFVSGFQVSGTGFLSAAGQIGCYYNASNDFSNWSECSSNPKIYGGGWSNWAWAYDLSPDFARLNDTAWILSFSGKGYGDPLYGQNGIFYIIIDNITGYNYGDAEWYSFMVQLIANLGADDTIWDNQLLYSSML
jgi:hypothetical protein